MSDSGPALPRVAVLIPCYNESVAIGRVVADFRKALPESCVYVYDNNSTDGTAEAARTAGALLGRETAQGKGHVVRRMFADVDADVYVLVDGDATYEAASAPGMVARLLEGQLDMVVGCRAETGQDVFRRGHRCGNALLSLSVGFLFRQRVTDMLSGYRVFSRRFVKSFPVLSAGFEIETEMSVHALELRMPVGEGETSYGARPQGSQSKLSTYGDGWRILRTIGTLYRVERPVLFYGALSTLLLVAAILL